MASKDNISLRITLRFSNNVSRRSNRVGALRAGNFVYIGTSGLLEGVQGHGYRAGMLIHRATIFNHNTVKESLPFYYPLLVHLVTCLKVQGPSSG